MSDIRWKKQNDDRPTNSWYSRRGKRISSQVDFLGEFIKKESQKPHKIRLRDSEALFHRMGWIIDMDKFAQLNRINELYNRGENIISYLSLQIKSQA